MQPLFRKFINNPNIKNSFLELFCNNLVLLPKYEEDPNRVAFTFRVPEETANLQGTMHGGAISSLVDIVTTIGILKVTPIKSASISL